LGEYLRYDGYQKIVGVDYSRKILAIASMNKCYQSLERVIFGQKGLDIPQHHLGAYDFVIAPSLINNNDLDRTIFENLISCCKIGGFIIFATKLNYFK